MRGHGLAAVIGVWFAAGCAPRDQTPSGETPAAAANPGPEETRYRGSESPPVDRLRRIAMDPKGRGAVVADEDGRILVLR